MPHSIQWEHRPPPANLLPSAAMRCRSVTRKRPSRWSHWRSPACTEPRRRSWLRKDRSGRHRPRCRVAAMVEADGNREDQAVPNNTDGAPVGEVHGGKFDSVVDHVVAVHVRVKLETRGTCDLDPAMSAQLLGRRFTESNRARSSATLNSRAMFCRSSFVEEFPNCATAKVTKIASTAITINTSITEKPLCLLKS